MQTVAQSWLIYEKTGSSALLGYDAFLGGFPIMLLSLYGGVVADRKDRRIILIWSQVTQMFCALVLALVLLTKVLDGMPLIYLMLTLSFISGCAQAFGGPAYQALIPSLVKREEMPNAIALNSIQFNVARIIGPVLGGLALTTLGGVWCFFLNGLSFFPVILSLYLARPDFTPKPTSLSVLDSAKQGLRFIYERAGMRALIGLAFTMTALGIPFATFLPVYSKNVFQGGSELFTTMLTVSGLGSVFGALVVANSSKGTRKGDWALALLGLLGVLIAVFAVSRNLPLTMITLFLSGGALIGTFALVASLVQEVVPNELRGRVMSVYNVAFRGGMPIGNLATGQAMELYAAPVVLVVEGVLLVCAAVYFFFAHSVIRHFSHTHAEARNASS